MKFIGLKTSLAFLILFAISCKKEEPEIPVFKEPTADTLPTTTAVPAQHFTFTKVGNSFTYEKRTLQMLINDTTSFKIDTFTVSVISSVTQFYYKLDNNLPEINSLTIYSDSSILGTSPIDTIIPIDPISRKSYFHSAFGVGSYLAYYLEKGKTNFNGNSVDSYSIDQNDNGLGDSFSLKMEFSPKYGVLSSIRSSSDDIRLSSSTTEYILISTNF